MKIHGRSTKTFGEMTCMSRFLAVNRDDKILLLRYQVDIAFDQEFLNTKINFLIVNIVDKSV